MAPLLPPILAFLEPPLFAIRFAESCIQHFAPSTVENQKEKNYFSECGGAKFVGRRSAEQSDHALVNPVLAVVQGKD